MESNYMQKKFPLVGVGASAGGLDSFQKFLKAIPANSGMAYILVQHLSPSHQSILPEILSKATSIPVQEISDDCNIKPDHIYVIPENQMLEITDYSLKLSPRKQNVQNMPIDVFFSSLARVHGTYAIGIVLSGTARDGTVGLKEIKEHGGITFAEDPNSATWDGMPKNAIDAGVVDFVLPVEEIPAKLVNVYALYESDAVGDDDQNPNTNESRIRKILSVVQQHSGVDFSFYKRPTVLRRIDRRMAINQISEHHDYLGFLIDNRVERESLFQDLLIKVTSFFRDPEIFEELVDTVIPQILKNQDPEDPVRIWIPACCTGEEAYSLAIILFDALGGLTAGHNLLRTKIQIFASDISEVAIKKARTGIYSAAEVEPLSENQLEDYFTRTDGSYQVVKPIRDTIVFATHNFLKDPPFGKVNLISCRNVFIYLDPFLQRKALSTFHYALKEKGFLLLGKTETIGTPSDQFIPFSQEEKIYIRKPGSSRFLQFATTPRTMNEVPNRVPLPSMRASRTDFKKSAEAVLVSRYTPASVIVDGHMEVVHINGSVTPFLEPSSGKPTHELMKMARKELAFELRNALHKAKESQEAVIKEGIPIIDNGNRFLASIEIVPLTNIVDPYFLVLFQKKSRNAPFLKRAWKKLKPTFSSKERNFTQQRVTALEMELEQAREDMRSISEEQEAYSEELQSANEELLSSNEEMQSLNEELETSKEELQSTNEELIILNRELNEKQNEQNRTLNYLDAVIANLREPFVVLEHDFKIRTANAAYYKRFDVDETETQGKSFFEIQDKIWNNSKLHTMIKNVLPKTVRIVDEEVVINQPPSGQWCFMFNAREIVYEQESNKLILLSIEDITERSNA